jgi:hypothetical protein
VSFFALPQHILQEIWASPKYIERFNRTIKSLAILTGLLVMVVGIR